MCFIQMLCEDYEVFLEIAHVLKGLDVSILKGVLEHRSAKLWASFVIEVYIKDSLVFNPFWSGGASKIDYVSEHILKNLICAALCHVTRRHREV